MKELSPINYQRIYQQRPSTEKKVIKIKQWNPEHDQNTANLNGLIERDPKKLIQKYEQNVKFLEDELKKKEQHSYSLYKQNSYLKSLLQKNLQSAKMKQNNQHLLNQPYFLDKQKKQSQTQLRLQQISTILIKKDQQLTRLTKQFDELKTQNHKANNEISYLKNEIFILTQKISAKKQQQYKFKSSILPRSGSRQRLDKDIDKNGHHKHKHNSKHNTETSQKIKILEKEVQKNFNLAKNLNKTIEETNQKIIKQGLASLNQKYKHMIFY